MAGWIGVGVGGAALVAASVLAGVAASDHADLEARCVDGACPSSVDPLWSRGSHAAADASSGGSAHSGQLFLQRGCQA